MGFSLIELSIVILVIGILVAGVTKGGSIMTKARIGSAKSLTSSSPAAVIPDLVAWYEPVLSSSFNPANAFDGTTLTVSATTGASWYDNSPAKNNNATTVTGGITYRESSINNIPSVRFGEANSTTTLAFNSSALNKKDYTIFVVEQRRVATSGTVGRFLSLGGIAATPNSLGYSGATTISDSNGGSFTAVPAYAPSSPRISTFTSNLSANTRRVFVNGTEGLSGSSNGANGTGAVITATSLGLIGADIATTSSYYKGDIAEIIIYNRALKVDERNDIQNYLSKKYGIKVSISS